MLASIDLEQGLEEAWQDVVTFAPKLLGFFLILLIGWFVAKALSKAADALLERVGFDGWVERGSVKAAFDRSKTDASDLIGVIVFWIVFLITLQLAFGIWGPNPISDLLAGVIAYLPNLIVAVIILVIAAMLASVVTDILTPTLGAVQGGETIARLAGLAILVLGIFAALDQLEIAPMIVTGLFYALLVVVVGSLVVAFGGGGIPVAREYLSRWSVRASDTARDIRQNADVEAGRHEATQVDDSDHRTAATTAHDLRYAHELTHQKAGCRSSSETPSTMAPYQSGRRGTCIPSRRPRRTPRVTAFEPNRSRIPSSVESIAVDDRPSNGSAIWTASSPDRLLKVMPMRVMPRRSIVGRALPRRTRQAVSSSSVSAVASGIV